MSLKITRALEPIEVKTITVCLYSVPGIGKTSTGFTADKPLLLDFDKGGYRSKNRHDTVQVEAWEDVTAITADDLKPYRTVVVDTAGRALDCLTAEIIRATPKFGRGGALTLQGYGELKSTFIAWTKMIRSFGLDVVLLSHSDEQRDGDDVRERLDIQGGSKNEIYKASDCMGRLYLKGGKRILNFSPSDTAFGKNPAQLQPIEVPDFATTPDFLGALIAKIKASLNEASAAQLSAATLLDEWSAKVDGATTAEEFNALIPASNEIDESVRDNAKRVLVKGAKAKGVEFDKTAKAFVGTAPAAPPAAAPAPTSDQADVWQQIAELVKELGWTKPHATNWLKKHFKVSEVSALKETDAQEVIGELNALAAEAANRVAEVDAAL